MSTTVSLPEKPNKEITFALLPRKDDGFMAVYNEYWSCELETIYYDGATATFSLSLLKQLKEWSFGTQVIVDVAVGEKIPYIELYLVTLFKDRVYVSTEKPRL